MQRLRQYRTDKAARDACVEVTLSHADFICPYFVVEGTGIRTEISSMPGVFHMSVDRLTDEVGRLIESGVTSVMLFGVIESSLKDAYGTAAYSTDNLITRAVASIKKAHPSCTVITDVCLCGYTDHGHCGVLESGDVHNDRTLPLLSSMAVSHAEAGADYVAPSAMMDGQVAAIRSALDDKGLTTTRIFSYSIKYASAFYGPFRDAAHSAPQHGDRKTYQMDYRNKSQALREIQNDLDERADWVMVKPALPYLDVIHTIRAHFPECRLAGYQVSGEYMMIKTTAAQGLADEHHAAIESLYAIKRAGADKIISYFASEVTRLLVDVLNE